MTNDATVTKLMPNNTAEVVVTRLTACGGNCGGCEGCVYDNKVRAVANNLVGAKPGDKVVIESQSSKVFGAVALVYIMPLVFFLAGYFIAAAFGTAEGVCIAVSFAALLVSAVILVVSQKRKKEKITYNIIKKADCANKSK